MVCARSVTPRPTAPQIVCYFRKMHEHENNAVTSTTHDRVSTSDSFDLIGVSAPFRLRFAKSSTEAPNVVTRILSTHTLEHQRDLSSYAPR